MLHQFVGEPIGNDIGITRVENAAADRRVEGRFSFEHLLPAEWDPLDTVLLHQRPFLFGPGERFVAAKDVQVSAVLKFAVETITFDQHPGCRRHFPVER